MKIIIGAIILYIFIVVLTSALAKYIWNTQYKGTEHEMFWKEPLKCSGIAYFIIIAIISVFISFLHFCL